MSKKVCTFQQVEKGGYRYLFMLVVWNDYYDAVRSELQSQSDAFGADLRLDGMYVEPYKMWEIEIGDEVLAKPWPTEVRDRLENDPEPILLVIERDFAAFDPRENPWAIIWLSDFERAAYDIKPLLQTLARKTRQGEDVITFLRDVAERESKRRRSSRIIRAAVQAGSYVAWKPTLPIIGIGIDVKAILHDIAASRAG